MTKFSPFGNFFSFFGNYQKITLVLSPDFCPQTINSIAKRVGKGAHVDITRENHLLHTETNIVTQWINKDYYHEEFFPAG